jgi:hypothetical protein
MTEEIGLSIRKLPENTLLYPVVGQIKIRKLLLIGLETNTMSPYSYITSYNSSPERCEGATSFLIMPIKKSFMFFLYL